MRILALAAALAAAVLSASVLAQTPSPQAATAQTAPAATPTPTDTVARQKEFLDGIRERVEMPELDQQLNPAFRLPGMMSALTGLLGVTCTTCHVPGHFESEELAPKRTARQHFKMQAALNQEYFGGANAISCWTCHRGAAKPPIQ